MQSIKAASKSKTGLTAGELERKPSWCLTKKADRAVIVIDVVVLRIWQYRQCNSLRIKASIDRLLDRDVSDDAAVDPEICKVT